jgi:hypothetical protein
LTFAFDFLLSTLPHLANSCQAAPTPTMLQTQFKFKVTRSNRALQTNTKACVRQPVRRLTLSQAKTLHDATPDSAVAAEESTETAQAPLKRPLESSPAVFERYWALTVAQNTEAAIEKKRKSLAPAASHASTKHAAVPELIGLVSEGKAQTVTRTSARRKSMPAAGNTTNKSIVNFFPQLPKQQKQQYFY